MKERLKGLGLALAFVMGAGAVVGTLGGFFGGAWWVLDLVSHFRVQLLVGALGASALFFVAGQRIIGGVFLAGAVVNLVLVAPFLLPLRGEEPTSTVRIGVMNLETSNRQAHLVRQELERAQPDIVVLLEYTGRWAEELEGDVGDLEHVVAAPRESPFGIAILSSLPLLEHEELNLIDGGGPALRARFEVFGQQMQLLAIHPFPPLRARGTRFRNDELAAAAEIVRAADVPTVVAGDLNASYWSHGFRLLTGPTELRSAARGHGITATWPAGNLLLRVPIDHVLVPPSVTVGDVERGRFTGSDHFPVWVDVGW